MKTITINDTHYEVEDAVADEFQHLTDKLDKVDTWLDKTDSVVNGCGIEKEYDELFDIMNDDRDID